MPALRISFPSMTSQRPWRCSSPSPGRRIAPPGTSARSVAAARRRQERRLGPGGCNAEIGPAELRRLIRLEGDAKRALADGYDRLGLSGRGWDRVMRVARTIADIFDSELVTEEHVNEALTLRRKPGQ